MDIQLIFLILFLLFVGDLDSTRIRGGPSSILTRNIEEENGPLVLSEAIQGSVGRLPCNVTPPVPEDRVALVIWYKVGSKTPIYSVDTRDSNFSQGSHWSDDAYGERLSFAISGRSATLKIQKTRQEDTGEYRCRVDFQKSPTRNSKVNLTVITPPENLVILDSKGNHIPHYILGPYNEGASVNITCVSTGGRPQPKVTWWHENTQLDDTSHSLSDRRVANVLSLGKLKRKNLNMQLTCKASNNNLTPPISSTVTLDMNLRPLLVKLQGENRPLSADNIYQLSCVVIGSRPAPTITWWKGSTPMKNTHEISNPDGNMTTSILTFTPTIDDRGKFLSCRAEQSMIPESGMEDGWKLDIYHIPVVTLELGTNSMNSSFREGIDVFFECNIKSNPWVYKVSWRHNGNPLENNLGEGIIVANQSLVLQNVSRARSGIYTCVGSNREGDGESNPVQLDIRFAPVCRPGQRTIYSSGRHETVKVACEVEANPSEVLFSWKFNATATESIDIPASLVAIERGRSVAHYTPMTENDYGTLLCWSSNEIGDQSEPCVYTISPAGEPDPLINCTLLNQTSTGFQIECLEGFDGGLQQDFIMEVYVNGTTRHPRIYKSKTPFFEVRGLVPGAGYNVFLVAHNSKGRSNATILQVYTLKDPEKQTVVITFKKQPKDNSVGGGLGGGEKNDKNLSLAYAPVIEDIRPFLGILLGIVGSIFIVALIIVIIVRMRGSSGRDRNNYSHQVSRAGTLHNGPSMQDIRIGRETCQTSSVDSIDKNPDIIPQDGRDDEDEWTTTKGHSRAYATAALAEQNAIITSSTYDRIPTYAVIDKKTAQNHIQQQLQHQQQQQQQQQHLQQASQQQHLLHHHGTPQYITTYNTLIPVSKMGYATQQQQQQQQHPNQMQQHQQQVNKTDLTYAELAATGGQRIPYCSATLGRPRQSDIKRAEPNIYSQIDLAHHPMYSTSPMFGTNTITGVTMSHPSQLATFSTPTPIFASHKNALNPGKVLTATTSSPAGSGIGVGVGGVGSGVFIGSNGGGGGGGPGSGMQSPVNSGSMLCLTGVGGGVAAMQQQQQQQHQQQLQQQQQHQLQQPPSAVICTSIAPSSLVGISNGLHPVGVPSAGVAGGCFGEANQSAHSILKTVPEELHHQIMTSEDLAKSKERSINHATRF